MRRRPAAGAELFDRGISLNVMSKAYGLPGLRIGWIACRDRALLQRMEGMKHYLSICNSRPSEVLATIALEIAAIGYLNAIAPLCTRNLEKTRSLLRRVRKISTSGRRGWRLASASPYRGQTAWRNIAGACRGIRRAVASFEPFRLRSDCRSAGIASASDSAAGTSKRGSKPGAITCGRA